MLRGDLFIWLDGCLYVCLFAVLFMRNAGHCRGHWHKSVEGASQLLRFWFGGHLWGRSSLAQWPVTKEGLEQYGGRVLMVAKTWFRKLRVGCQKHT